jgi:hypothetical protein
VATGQGLRGGNLLRILVVILLIPSSFCNPTINGRLVRSEVCAADPGDSGRGGSFGEQGEIFASAAPRREGARS